MPATKKIIERYRILDKCFRNHHKRYYIDDLIDECEKASIHISRRTIFEDINNMEAEFDFDLQRITDEGGKKVYYRYADPDFSIDNCPLSPVEISQLNSAIETLAQFKGLPQFDWIEDILDKLTLSSDVRSNDVVGFDTNLDLKGREKIGELYQYIINRVVVKVGYQSFKWAEPRQITFHPHYLKQYNNRWFVLGYNSDDDIEGWNMALDRIRYIRPAHNRKYIPSDICWREYFDDFIGVTNTLETPVEEVVLHCYGITGKYIETKPIHASQRSKWIDENCLQVRLKVKQNFELENFILGQGCNIKVISPESLRRKIEDIAIKINALYQKQ